MIYTIKFCNLWICLILNYVIYTYFLKLSFVIIKPVSLWEIFQIFRICWIKWMLVILKTLMGVLFVRINKFHSITLLLSSIKQVKQLNYLGSAINTANVKVRRYLETQASVYWCFNNIMLRSNERCPAKLFACSLLFFQS